MVHSNCTVSVGTNVVQIQRKQINLEAFGKHGRVVVGLAQLTVDDIHLHKALAIDAHGEHCVLGIIVGIFFSRLVETVTALQTAALSLETYNGLSADSCICEEAVAATVGIAEQSLAITVQDGNAFVLTFVNPSVITSPFEGNHFVLCNSVCLYSLSRFIGIEHERCSAFSALCNHSAHILTCDNLTIDELAGVLGQILVDGEDRSSGCSRLFHGDGVDVAAVVVLEHSVHSLSLDTLCGHHPYALGHFGRLL